MLQYTTCSGPLVSSFGHMNKKCVLQKNDSNDYWLKQYMFTLSYKGISRMLLLNELLNPYTVLP